MTRPIKVFFLKQGFVVSGYRSMAVKLGQIPGLELALGIPRRFRELGGQDIAYEPVTGDANVRSFVFQTICLHVQVVLFLGLGKALRKFFRKSPFLKTSIFKVFWGEVWRGTFFQKRSSPQILFLKDCTNVFLCYAEPYSVTAFLAYLTARLVLGRRFKFVCNTFQNIRKDFSFPLRWIQAFLFKRSDAIIASNSEAKEVLLSQGYRGEIWALPLWFNSEAFFPLKRPERERRVRVGFLGAISEDKGVPDLLEAVASKLETYKDKIELHLAGDGPIRDLVQKKVGAFNQMGLSSKYHGAIPFKQVPGYLNQMDILVMPSRTASHWKEQFGRIIIEAWACGTAVIGSNSGAIPEVLDDSRLVFQERNPLQLCLTLDFCMSHLNTLQKEALDKSTRYADTHVANLYARHLQTL